MCFLEWGTWTQNLDHDDGRQWGDIMKKSYMYRTVDPVLLCYIWFTAEHTNSWWPYQIGKISPSQLSTKGPRASISKSSGKPAFQSLRWIHFQSTWREVGYQASSSTVIQVLVLVFSTSYNNTFLKISRQLPKTTGEWLSRLELEVTQSLGWASNHSMAVSFTTCCLP